MLISTEKLISSSEARRRFGQLVSDVHDNENYYVILENGKVAAVLVHPLWLEKKKGENFPDLEKLREEWGRHSGEVSSSLEKLEAMDSSSIPKLLK